MTGLPPVAPVTGWREPARLPRDHYVRLDGNDYSVDPAVTGRRIEVTADLARVRVTCDGRVVADQSGSGPGIRPSPTRRTWRRRGSCGGRRGCSPRCPGRPATEVE